MAEVRVTGGLWGSGERGVCVGGGRGRTHRDRISRAKPKSAILTMSPLTRQFSGLMSLRGKGAVWEAALLRRVVRWCVFIYMFFFFYDLMITYI